ncbi:MAG: M48 family metallopeptidase [Flavobacteriales bacterium]|nr:M48 family metallopeptidase [Flavobacteriales bacterium]
MTGPINVTFYDGLSSLPKEARVQWISMELLEVEYEGVRNNWPIKDPRFSWEATGGALRLSFGMPPQVVIIKDEAVKRHFMEHFQRTAKHRKADATVPLLFSRPVLFLLSLIAVGIAAYVWMMPLLAGWMATLLPVDADRRIGEAYWSSMAPTLQLDTARSAALQRFGDRLELAPDFTLKYHVAVDDQVNAFALPGGHIVVYTGILDRMKEPGELAALLAHEGTHVQLRHSMRGIMRELSGAVFLSLIIGDVGSLMTIVAERADDLRGLSYTRGLESEADAVGMERMTADGLDPQGMLKLLQLLEREAQDMPEGLSFLSSHPLTTERIAAAQEKAKALGHAPSPDAELERLFVALKAEE